MSQHFLPNYTGSAKPKYGVLDHLLLRRRTANCIVFMVSALNISREPRPLDKILARDCIWPPVLSSWFLLHTATHLATMHFHLQEHRHGMRYRPVSPLQDVILNIIPPGLLRESSLPNSFNFLRHMFAAVFIINMSHSKHVQETKQA